MARTNNKKGTGKSRRQGREQTPGLPPRYLNPDEMDAPKGMLSPMVVAEWAVTRLRQLGAYDRPVGTPDADAEINATLKRMMTHSAADIAAAGMKTWTEVHGQRIAQREQEIKYVGIIVEADTNRYVSDTQRDLLAAKAGGGSGTEMEQAIMALNEVLTRGGPAADGIAETLYQMMKHKQETDQSGQAFEG